MFRFGDYIIYNGYIGTFIESAPGEMCVIRWKNSKIQVPISELEKMSLDGVDQQLRKYNLADNSFTKSEILYLSDIVWWLKGNVASRVEDDKNEFGHVHVDALIKAIGILKNQ